MEWTADAIAAAGGMEPMPPEVLSARKSFPPPYRLAGSMPNSSHKDAARILAVCAARETWHQSFPGLVMETNTNSDRWYITFHEPDADHAEEWFWEASGGEGELYSADDFESFLWRLDIPVRSIRAETRNGFRTLVFEDPASFTRTDAA